jgi:hypothetical protein
MLRKSVGLELSRAQILGFRRRAGLLDERLPASAKSLRFAAWAGLQDSMPRAALLSIHARVKGCHADHWEHPSLVQLWGPRFNVYVVAEKDLPVFSLARLPDDARRRARAQDTALRLQSFLDGRRMPCGQAGGAWILADDEAAFQLSNSQPAAPARLLPSGDAYYLWWGTDREILVPDAKRRAELWTTRVWPGALLVNGEIAGVWRRSAAEVSIDTWRRLSSAEWEGVEAEAAALPLPGLNGRIAIHRS